MKTYRVDARVDGTKLSVGVRDAPSITEALRCCVPMLEQAARALLGVNHGPIKITAINEERA